MVASSSPPARVIVRADRPSRAEFIARDKKLRSESIPAIRPKIRFWRGKMRREAVKHENFLIAKVCDSESAQTFPDGIGEQRSYRAWIERSELE